MDLDAELNLQAEPPKDSTDLTLQVQIQNIDNSSSNRKISTEQSVVEDQKPETSNTKPASEPVKTGKPSPTSKSALIKSADLTHRDPGKHWCAITSKWLSSIQGLLVHLHSDEYQAKMNNKDKPWKKKSEFLQQKLKGQYFSKKLLSKL